MIKRNALKLSFLLVAALLAVRFTVNLRQRAIRAFPDKFSDSSFTEHLTLIWEVLRWSGPHLAPEGTQHITRYLSIPTPSGPVGLIPGQEVRVLRETGGHMIVTATNVTGSRELDVPRSALTDDLDLARNLANRDQSAHDEFRTRLEAEEAARERARLGLYKEAAATLAAAERTRAADVSTGIGGRPTVLNQGTTVYHSYAYPVAVPMYYPSVTGGTSAISPAAGGPAASSAGGGITIGGATARNTTNSTPQNYVTWRPGSPPPAAKPTPTPVPTQSSGRP